MTFYAHEFFMIIQDQQRKLVTNSRTYNHFPCPESSPKHASRFYIFPFFLLHRQIPFNGLVKTKLDYERFEV